MYRSYSKVSYKGASVKGYTTYDSISGDGSSGGCSCISLWYILNNYLTPTVTNAVRVSQLIVTTAFNMASDISIKKDITDIPRYETDKLVLLSGKCYALKSDPATTRFGYIAQDMEQVYPTLVTTCIEPNNTTIKTIDYIGLIPLIIEKLKHIDHKLDNLNPSDII